MPTFPTILHSVDSAARASIVHSIPGYQVEALNRSFAEWAAQERRHTT